MLDPITAYAAKIAATTTAGGILSAWSLVQAQTGVDVGSAVTAASGVGLLAAGCWKLLADHTAVERERQTLTARIDALEAEVAKAETAERYERELRQRIELDAARLGVLLPTLRDLPHDRPDTPKD